MATKAELQAEIIKLTQAVERLTKALEARPVYRYPYYYQPPWYPYWGTVWCGDSISTSSITATNLCESDNLVTGTSYRRSLQQHGGSIFGSGGGGT